MNKYKKGLLGLMLVLLVATPALAKNGEDNSGKGNARDRLDSLLERIHNFRFDLSQFRDRNRDDDLTCYEFKRNLGVGSNGDAVVKLHAALEKFGFESKNTNHNNYDEFTAEAVVRFQARYGIMQTGFVGPITRTQLNNLILKTYTCDRDDDNDDDDVEILSVTGPANLAVREQGTWTLKTDHDDSESIRYSVRWGDESSRTTLEGASLSRSTDVQTTTFTHRYASAGTYTITFTATDESGDSDSYSVKVSVGKTDQNRAPSLQGISGPTVLARNQIGTWTVRAADPEGGVLEYGVSWGDTKRLDVRTLSLESAGAVQTSTFTHAYTTVGTYTVKFQVTDESGATADTSITVRVTN